MKDLIKRIVTAAVVFGFLTTALFVQSTAAIAALPADEDGGGSGATSDSISLKVTKQSDVGVENIGQLISAMFNVAIVVAVIFVFFMLILGGYGWITAGGDKAKVEEARTRITDALIGLAIVAAAWALITVIGQFFGVDIGDIQFEKATGTIDGSV